VLAELEAETPYPLSQAVRDLEAALDRTSFYQRLSERLDSDSREQDGQDQGPA
jgi:hypothetical protein